MRLARWPAAHRCFNPRRAQMWSAMERPARQKYTVLLNGIQQGWAGEATSFTAPGSLGITYDGIPVADPATGLWQSATMPQNLVIQDVQVTYGPGQAADRWYTDEGGRVEFTPIQPTVDRHLSAAVTDGPYGQQNFAFVGNTGTFKGWSTVLGGGMGRGDDFRQAPDGFGNPTQNGSVFGKTVKTFSAGSFAFGVLYAKGGGYRPPVIPTTDVGLIEPGSGIHYSQATSGFYSALPYADYNKYDTNEVFMAYARQRIVSEPYVHAREFDLVHPHSPFSPAQRGCSGPGRPGGRVEQPAQQHVWRPDRVYPGSALQHGPVRRLPHSRGL